MTTSFANTEAITEVEVPEVFIAEYLDGIPMYYKGYKKIINNPSQIEEIMGGGGIHSLFLMHFGFLLNKILDDNKYCIIGGETGLRAEKKNLFSLNVAVYYRESLSAQPLEYEFQKLSPVIVVEVDTSVENDAVTEDEYIFKKTQRLIDFGTQRVVWFFSRTKKIMMAQPDTAWQIHNWDVDIELIDGVRFNLYNYCVENRLLNMIKLSW